MPKSELFLNSKWCTRDWAIVLTTLDAHLNDYSAILPTIRHWWGMQNTIVKMLEKCRTRSGSFQLFRYGLWCMHSGLYFQRKPVQLKCRPLLMACFAGCLATAVQAKRCLLGDLTRYLMSYLFFRRIYEDVLPVVKTWKVHWWMTIEELVIPVNLYMQNIVQRQIVSVHPGVQFGHGSFAWWHTNHGWSSHCC